MVKIWGVGENASNTPIDVDRVSGTKTYHLADLHESRAYCMNRLNKFRQDILRPLNPTPYKLAVSDKFFHFFKDKWQQQAPVKELS